jgi:hypothetical protein
VKTHERVRFHVATVVRDRVSLFIGEGRILRMRRRELPELSFLQRRALAEDLSTHLSNAGYSVPITAAMLEYPRTWDDLISDIIRKIPDAPARSRPGKSPPKKNQVPTKRKSKTDK